MGQSRPRMACEPLLRLTVRCNIFAMAKSRHILIFCLLALWTATPTLRCLVPTEAMTAEEHGCCKKMAGDCGSMKSEHSCCKKTVISSQDAVSISVVKVNNPQGVIAEPVPVISNLIDPHFGPVLTRVYGPSPPLLLSTSTVLRI